MLCVCVYYNTQGLAQIMPIFYYKILLKIRKNSVT